jgi:hypothetical protein
MRSFTSTRIVRFVLAPMLSLWLAGAGCMMGCEGMVAAAATVPSSNPENHSGHPDRKATIVAPGHACSSGSHSCCAKTGETKTEENGSSNEDTTLITLGGSSSGMMKDCPLAMSRAVIAAKIRNNEVAAAPAIAHSILPAENLLERTSPISPPTRLLNRGHTYLRCCVFLI